MTSDRPDSAQRALEDFFELEATLLRSYDCISSDNDALRDATQQSRRVGYLNHGAFGDPHPSTLKLRGYVTDELCYRQPMVYHRSLIPTLVQRAKHRACEYLKIGKEYDFNFVNVTGALFAVLRSVQFEPGDTVVTSDMLYHSLTDALMHLQHKHQLNWVIVSSPHGCKQDDIYDSFERTIQRESQRIKLVIVDHISSKPSVVFPARRICKLCNALRIPTLVDGAHVPGSIPSQFINVVGATFYAVTFHKWVNTPRGASGALLVNRKIIQEQYASFIDVSCLVVHGGWADQPMGAVPNGGAATSGAAASATTTVELYLDDANKPGIFTDGLTQGIYDESTREYENVVVLPHCLDLVLKFETEFQNHVIALRQRSLQVLQELWQLEPSAARIWYGEASPPYCIPLLSVPLPTHRLLQAARFDAPRDMSLSQKLRRIKKKVNLQLWDGHGIEVPVFVFGGQHLGVRISLGRFVTMEDIRNLGLAVNALIDQGFAA